MINKHRKIIKTTSPVQNEQGDILTNENEIRQEWTSYNKRLYSWENDLRCHNENAKFIEEQLEIISQSEHNEIDEVPIQVRETRDVIENLKCNKASGWDSIVAENVKHGGADADKYDHTAQE